MKKLVDVLVQVFKRNRKEKHMVPTNNPEPGEQRTQISPPPPCSTPTSPIAAPVLVPLGPPNLGDMGRHVGEEVSHADWKTAPVNSFAGKFPMMSGEAFEQFKRDLAEHGQQTPLVMYRGELIDGRNRRRALIELGLEAQVLAWNGEGGTVEEFIIGQNLHRRHLDETQRALTAARFVLHWREEKEIEHV